MRMSSVRIAWMALAGAALLVARGPARGDEKSGAPKAASEMEVLKHLEGTWETTAKMGDTETKGKAIYRTGLGGIWMLEHFQGEFNGQKFEGHGATSYDPNKKKYVSVWIDSMAPTVLNMEGTYDADSKTMTMKGEGPGPDGKQTHIKTVSTLKSPDHMVFHMYMGGEDKPALTIDYKRSEGGRGKQKDG